MIGVPGKSGSKCKGRRVHVNTLEGDELNEQQRKTLDECLGKWQEVLTSVPGKTEVLLHDIKSGEVPPICSVPYQIPHK